MQRFRACAIALLKIRSFTQALPEILLFPKLSQVFSQNFPLHRIRNQRIKTKLITITIMFRLISDIKTNVPRDSGIGWVV